jgi:hypothetical protein
MTMNVEAPGESKRIMPTDEDLSSLPLYVSRLRGIEEQAEVEAMFEAFKLDLRSRK